MSCQSATVWPVTHLQSCGCRNLVLVYHVIENLGKAHMYYCYAHRYKFNIITVMFSSCFTLFGGCLQAFYFVHVKPSFVFGIFIVEHKKKTLSALRHTFHESYINDAQNFNQSNPKANVSLQLRVICHIQSVFLSSSGSTRSSDSDAAFMSPSLLRFDREEERSAKRREEIRQRAEER